MQYSTAANWDFELLDRLKGTSVTGLYGQIWNDPLGGGRMSIFIPRIERKEAASYIREAGKKGLGFNYLINATCFDNLEFTKKGYARIMEHLEWISSTGADMVTVSLPFLVQMVKSVFPDLKVAVSSFARIQNSHIARYWEDLGADKIILPEIVARDFKTLRLIRRSVKCELELIANHLCLYHCPIDLHHRNMVSHGSQAGHPCGGFAADYCKINCQRLKLVDPAEIIKSRWIRPEDVGRYEDSGIDCLKIVERFRSTDSLMEIVYAYGHGSYSGNLANLLSLPQDGANKMPNLDMIERPDLIDPEKMKEIFSILREPFSERLFIDNSRLEGFLEYFEKADCLHMDCNACGYCQKVAKDAISIDDGWRRDMIAKFDEAVKILISGELAGL
ncbi:putative Peptidase, U32 superfamily [uncultured Desulfobacterium sp.]|uniref:Putative Peptidase, U32 superfamily n=1 Tax=uncultured Desulfobacterium sp. TaxID=201089 RepID=A0A445N0N1_9BACT|nr:putative Peptidase, U32 superfamily [uncultured Desulfobacterium sp.]